MDTDLNLYDFYLDATRFEIAVMSVSRDKKDFVKIKKVEDSDTESNDKTENSVKIDKFTFAWSF